MNQIAKVKPALTLGIVQYDTQSTLETSVEQGLLKSGLNLSIERFPTQEDAFRAVTEGKIDAFTCPLHCAPLALPLGLVITALSERLETKNCFVTKNTSGLIFEKAKKVKVLVMSDINRVQLQNLQPHFEVIKTDLSPKKSIEAVRCGEVDGVVLSQTELNIAGIKTDEWHIQSFSVREFIPSAGQGTACFITAEDDLPTRRLLQDIHHSTVSAVTNIERTVQKLLKDYEICAYCERDRMGNYHLWAAALVKGELIRTRLSQSTSFGMAEKAATQLFSA